MCGIQHYMPSLVVPKFHVMKVSFENTSYLVLIKTISLKKLTSGMKINTKKIPHTAT